MSNELEVIEAEVVEAGNLPAVQAGQAIMARAELSIEEVVAQKDKIVAIMRAVMTEGVHYGTIPGTDKPTLYKPGAEAINVALRLAPHYESVKTFHEGGHLTVAAACTLKHIPSDLTISTGEGLCTSMEAKYAYRSAKRTCPACGAPAIIKGKAEYGGGWVCWKKEGGCGNTFPDDDARVTAQLEGKVPNPELPDTWNTVLKMADKRALIAAVLNGTAASDVFTQDIGDDDAGGSEPPENPVTPAARQDHPAVPVPKSWPAIEKVVRSCDNEGEAWALWEAFIRAACYHLYGKTSLKEIETAQRQVMAQKAAGAAVWLQENAPSEGPFTFYDEPIQRKAWAAMLDGTLLAIPDYVPPEPPGADEEAERIAAEVFDGS